MLVKLFKAIIRPIFRYSAITHDKKCLEFGEISSSSPPNEANTFSTLLSKRLPVKLILKKQLSKK